MLTQEVQYSSSDSLYRDGNALLTNPSKVTKLDPIYGGTDPNNPLASPERSSYTSNSKEGRRNNSRLKRPNAFYYQCQLSFSEAVLYGFGLALIWPRMIHTWRYIRIGSLALAGVAVYPLYKIGGPDSTREALTHFYPTQTQLFKYAIQRLGEKYSLRRLWHNITGRINIVPPPVSSKKGKEQQNALKAWFGVRIKNKTEKGFQDVKHPQVVLERPLYFEPREFYLYYRKKLFDFYETHPLKIAANNLRAEYQFTNKTITLMDRAKMLRLYYGPNVYFLRFMKTKYLTRFYRHQRKQAKRELPFIMGIFAVGLWALPYPFRDLPPEQLGYVYVVTLAIILRTVKKFVPVSREVDFLKRYPPPVTRKEKFVKASFGIITFMVLGQLLTTLIYMTEKALSLDYYSYDEQAEKIELQEKLFREDNTLNFDEFNLRFNEMKERLAAAKSEFYYRTTLDYDIAKAYDPKKIFPKVSGGKPEHRQIEYVNNKGEQISINPTFENLVKLKITRALFSGDEEVVKEIEAANLERRKQYEDFMKRHKHQRKE